MNPPPNTGPLLFRRPTFPAVFCLSIATSHSTFGQSIASNDPCGKALVDWSSRSLSQVLQLFSLLSRLTIAYLDYLERFPYVKTRLMPRDKRWVHLEDSRLEQYRNGCEEFLDYAFSHAAIDDTIRCPCNKCKNKKRYDRDTVHYHLLQRRMYKPYGVGLWTLHNKLKEDDLGDAITKIDENKVDALRAGGIGVVEGDVVDGLVDLHKVSSYAIASGSDDSTANDSKRSIETLKPKGFVSMTSTHKKVRKSSCSNFSFGPTREEFNDVKRKMAKLDSKVAYLTGAVSIVMSTLHHHGLMVTSTPIRTEDGTSQLSDDASAS